MISSTQMEAYLQKFLQKFQHLKIQLEDITKATNTFNDKCIGVGGFGNVYKGELSHSEGQGMVAIKRLDSTSRQGAPEFLKEITMLSDYKHENVVSLLGFCCEGGEMILVYNLASRGSLDGYLNSPHLTWIQRLKICLDAAKGLSYLHDPRTTHRRLIHCDVKSGNILLDEQWNAKVSDLGLSIMGSANEQHSVIVTPAAGTGGYIDPLYWMTHTLTKESDIYSFGVVLLEIFCGMLCNRLDSKGHVENILVPMWKECFEQKKLNDIIFTNSNIQPMEQSALDIYSDIAYRCLNELREDRPEMAEVVKELEKALESQELLESLELLENQEFKSAWNKQCSYYEKIMKSAEPSLNYRSEVELMKLLFKGVFLNGGKRLFSLDKKGKHSEMISIAECLDSEYKFFSQDDSRFGLGSYFYRDVSVNTHVKTQFLSPGITYTVDLVFKFRYLKARTCEPICLRYKLQGEKESSVSHLAYKREDGWWMCELYQFTSEERVNDIEIQFEGFDDSTYIQAEGIEFRPLEKVDEKKPISDSDANCEEKMPTNYEDIMKRSENSVQWTTKKEAYSIIRKGFFISDQKTKRRIWFSIDKNGKKCHMLSATDSIWHWKPNFTSHSSRYYRFREDEECNFKHIYIMTKVESELVSSETTYAIYLVYKLRDQSGFEAPVEVDDKEWNKRWYIYLLTPQTPVIGPKAYQNTHNPLSRLKIKGIPEQRKDDWMEVQISEFQTATTINIDVQLTRLDGNLFSGLLVKGIEFRPI